jgi:EAL domain-containing protein (putative c-di-GMP-specific phosphodiesterase class I)
VGLGQSNYRMMLDCHPEYFKLDAYFVHGLSTDSKRRAVVESLVTLAKALESAVVAEGVDSNDDLLRLQAMGVDFVQANLLCAAIPLDELLATGYLNDPSFGKPARPEMRVKSVHRVDQRWTPSGLAAGQSFYT